MPLVFLTPYKKIYTSDICSLSTLIGFVLLIASILLPLFAAFSTEDFWLRIKEYEEQPLVEFQNKYMIYITNCSGNYKTYFDSSNKNLKEYFAGICNNSLNIDIDLCSQENSGILTADSTDIDNDGYIDKLNIKYELSNSELFSSTGIDIKMIFFLKYTLRKKVKLLMTPMVYIDIPIIITNNKGKEIYLNGNLELIQKSPIPCSTITSRIYYEEKPYFIEFNESHVFDLLYFYNKYKSHNYTVKYDYERYDNIDNNQKIKIDITMNIPKLQPILYFQSVFEALKYAWMQYFYIFLPIYLIFYILFKFIIQNKIFYSTTKSNLY